MHKFDGYTSVIYDTQCVIYYCFNTHLESVDGEQVPIKYDLTDLTIKVCDWFKRSKYKVRFLWCCDEEITREIIAGEIRKRASDQELLNNLGCEEIPKAIQYQLEGRFFKRFNRLKKQSYWFIIIDEEDFNPRNKSIVNNVVDTKKFFEKVESDPTLRSRLPLNKKPIPEYEDRLIMIYSARENLPILSNDMHITEFEAELNGLGLCHKAVKLDTIQF